MFFREIETFQNFNEGTPLTETIQVLELGSGYKILTINTTFYDDFFVFL